MSAAGKSPRWRIVFEDRATLERHTSFSAVGASVGACDATKRALRLRLGIPKGGLRFVECRPYTEPVGAGVTLTWRHLGAAL